MSGGEREHDYLWHGGGADAEIAELEQRLAQFRHDDEFDFEAAARAELPASLERGRRMRRFVPPAVALAAAAALLLLWQREPPEPEQAIGPQPGPCARGDAASWSLRSFEGGPTCGGEPMTEESRLVVGEWLTTDRDARVAVDVADIGSMIVGPESKLRLRATGSAEHRLELAHGSIHASVVAPPRLFVVETPAATAIDLGCEYDLTVAEDGSGSLVVTSGYVALERDREEMFVPAGAECHIDGDSGPGTPVLLTASQEFRAALAAFDRADEESRPGHLEAVLSAARSQDSLSLFHLIRRSNPEGRRRLFQTLKQFVPVPEGVTEELVSAGDAAALLRWRERLIPGWSDGGNFKKKRAPRKQ